MTLSGSNLQRTSRDARGVETVSSIPASNVIRVDWPYPTELSEALTILGGSRSLHVEQVVPDEDAREVNIGPEPAKPGVDLPMVAVELLDLRVDLLGAARCGRQGEDDERQNRRKSQRSNRPGPEPHHR